MSQPPLTDYERHLHFVIREKMTGFSVMSPKCRGALLTEIMHEMKSLKEELDDRKYGAYVVKNSCFLFPHLLLKLQQSSILNRVSIFK